MCAGGEMRRRIDSTIVIIRVCVSTLYVGLTPKKNGFPID